MSRTFILLCAGEYEQAEEIVKEYLHLVNFNIEYATDIINYEFIRQRLGKNVSKSRLNSLIDANHDQQHRFAAYALLEDYDAAFEQLRRAIERDFGVKYEVARWPLTDLVRDIPKFKRLLSPRRSASSAELRVVPTEESLQG